MTTSPIRMVVLLSNDTVDAHWLSCPLWRLTYTSGTLPRPLYVCAAADSAAAVVAGGAAALLVVHCRATVAGLHPRMRRDHSHLIGYCRMVWEMSSCPFSIRFALICWSY